jgi:uncharacterized low-complexity protein
MKNIVKNTALALALALSVGVPATFAKGKKVKPSAEHVAAIKKCNDDYAGAMKDAKGKKGKDRAAANAAAKATRKQCIASAPK